MEYCTTIGIDVSDRTSKICVMTKRPDGARAIVVETTCGTTREGFEEAMSKFDRSWPAVFETGTHCRWMDRLFRAMGFKTIVANPGKIPSITRSNTKNDRNDARELARLAIADPEMLHPVFLRDEVFQQMLRYHHARNMLMSQRVQTTNQIRGFAKSAGFRIEKSSTERFHDLDARSWPKDVEDVAWPLMDVLKTISEKIKAYDAMIAGLAERPEFKAMVERLMVVYGVGIVGATVFVASIGGRPDRFDKTRDIGAYFGMIPKQDQSGDGDKQLGITYEGAGIVRRVLVECAGVIMKSNAKDTDLKLKGLRISMRGGKVAKKKALVAVARSLAVMMLALLKDPEREYVPLSEEGRKGLERYNAELEYLTMQKSSGRNRKTSAAA